MFSYHAILSSEADADIKSISPSLSISIANTLLALSASVVTICCGPNDSADLRRQSWRHLKHVPFSPYFPNEQDAQFFAPAKPYFPIAQVPEQPCVSVVASIIPPYLPAGQRILLVTFGQYAPFGHRLQYVEPVYTAVFPTKHDLHALAFVLLIVLLYLPTGQNVQNHKVTRN